MRNYRFNSQKRKTLITHIVLMVVYATTVYLTSGVVLEAVTQKVAYFMSTSFFPEPFIQFGLKDYIGVNYIYKFLFSIAPHINWYPLSFFVLQLILGISIVYILIFKFYLPQKTALTIQVLTSSSILTMLFIQQIFLEHNSTSLLYGAVGVWLLILYQARTLQYIIGCLFLIISVAYRPEATTGVLLLFVPILILFRLKTIKLDLIHLSPVFLLLFSYYLLFIYKTSFSDEMYYQLEPDFEYEIMDRRNVVPISAMTSQNDAIKYEMVNAWLLCDPDTLDAKFIRSIINKENVNAKYNIASIFSNTKNIRQNLKKVFSSIEFISLLFIMLTLLVAIENKWRGIIKSLIYLSFILAIIIFNIASIDTQLDRLFFQTIITIASINLAFSIFTTNKKVRLNILHSLLIFSLPITLYLKSPFIINKIKQNNENIYEHLNDINVINSFSENIVVYMGSHDIFNCHTSILNIHPIFNSKKVIDFRMAQYYDTQNHRNILSSIVGIQNPSYIDILNFIDENRDHIMVIGSPDIMKVWTGYNQFIYQKDFEYEQINHQLLSDGENIYNLKK
ncbi:MAG: hypothetical protein M9888_06075 [Chitinophagales bacterium]|nr:hypothetical protein [Chitinophagales bacterium]